MIDTLIINAHPDPHSTASATNRMVAHLLDKLPAGSVQTVNLAEADISLWIRQCWKCLPLPCFKGNNRTKNRLR